jgi:hypothetical protein
MTAVSASSRNIRRVSKRVGLESSPKGCQYTPLHVANVYYKMQSMKFGGNPNLIPKRIEHPGMAQTAACCSLQS